LNQATINNKIYLQLTLSSFRPTLYCLKLLE